MKMAFISDEYCIKCKKVTNHCDGNCTVCVQLIKERRIEEWNNQNLEIKLNNLRERIEQLESGPGVY